MPKGVFKNPAARGRKIGKALRRGRYLHCEVCGEKFWRKPRDIKKGDCRFCSRSCYFVWQRGQPKRMSAEGRQRFVESHSKPRPSGWVNPNIGRHHTTEACVRMSEKLKARVQATGRRGEVGRQEGVHQDGAIQVRKPKEIA